MKNQAVPHVEQIRWTDIERRVDPSLREVLGCLKGLPLFKVRYHYRDLLVEDGAFCTPCKAIGAAEVCHLCQKLTQQTGYSDIPLSLVLDKCVEVHLACEMPHTRLMLCTPLRILRAGKSAREFFGVFESIAYLKDFMSYRRAPWSVSAGARSIYIMALTDTSTRNFYLPLTKKVSQESQLDSWSNWREDSVLVREIAILAGVDYCVEVVVFSQEAVLALWRSTSAQARLLNIHEEQSRHLLGYTAETARLHMNHEEAHDHHTLIAQHILRIASGDLPGFSPVVDRSMACGPFIDAQFWILSRLPNSAKTYPAILQPVHLWEPKSACYYSTSRPSLLVQPPINRPRSYIDEMLSIKSRIKKLGRNSKFLDLGSTQYYASESKQEQYRPKLDPSEFIPKELPTDIKLTTSQTTVVDPKRTWAKFFSGAVKIVRK